MERIVIKIWIRPLDPPYEIYVKKIEEVALKTAECLRSVATSFRSLASDDNF